MGFIFTLFYVWRMAWSGILRFLLGKDWLYKLQLPEFKKIRLIRNSIPQRLFTVRNIGSEFIQVVIPLYGFIISFKEVFLWPTIEEIYRKEVYEKFHKIKDTDVVIDVGAHVGLFTLKAAKKAKNGLVIAVEPFPLSFKLLFSNIKYNHLANVIPQNVALADCEGEAKLYLSNSSLGHTIVPEKMTLSKFGGRFIIVRVETLDSLVRKLKLRKVDYIKIDAEGAELLILKGAKETLLNNRGLRVVIASHHHPSESKEVVDFLRSLGFTAFSFHDDGKTYVYGKTEIKS